MRKGSLILGIESAVAGGSLSVFRDHEEVASWSGGDVALRAEGILVRVQDLLTTAGVQRSELTGIAASAGPGSFTGIRVGLATALGLARSLNVGFSSFQVLEAMASVDHLTGVAAIPMGRGAACAQHFEGGNPQGGPFNISGGELLSIDIQGTLLLHPGLIRFADTNPRVKVFNQSLAGVLARIAIRHPQSTTSPVFVSRPTT